MASYFILCLSSPISISQMLYPSPFLSPDRQPSYGSLRFLQRPKHVICSYTTDSSSRSSSSSSTTSNADGKPPRPMHHSPLLARLEERERRKRMPKKVYADEFELNHEVYATNSMVGYEHPPPHPVGYAAPWEEYYDELVGNDHIDPNEKPKTSLIRFLEDLNKKMAEDDAKAGKPPRKMYPNKDIKLKYDEGPRFLKPRGQVARYHPAPPVMSPLDWVLEGGATPYVKLPPIIFPKKKEDEEDESKTSETTEEGASSAEVVDHTVTVQSSNNTPAVPLSNQNIPEPCQPTGHTTEPSQPVNRVQPMGSVNQSRPVPGAPFHQNPSVPGVAANHRTSMPTVPVDQMPAVPANGNSFPSQYPPSSTDSPVPSNSPGSYQSVSRVPLEPCQPTPPSPASAPASAPGSPSYNNGPYQPGAQMPLSPSSGAYEPSPSEGRAPSTMGLNQNSSTNVEPHDLNMSPPLVPATSNPSTELTSSRSQPYESGLADNRVSPLQPSNERSPIQNSEAHQSSLPTQPSQFNYFNGGQPTSAPPPPSATLSSTNVRSLPLSQVGAVASPVKEAAESQAYQSILSPPTQPSQPNYFSSGVLASAPPPPSATVPSMNVGSSSLSQVGAVASPVKETAEDKLAVDVGISEFYDAKEGDIVLGVVASGNDIKLDVEIGSEKSAILPYRDLQSFSHAELESGLFEFGTNIDASIVGRRLLVKGGNESDPSNGIVEHGTVVVAEVMSKTLMDSRGILSCSMLARKFSWNRVLQLMQVGEPIQFEVEQFNAGGLLGEIEGIRAFLPRSELLQRPESAASLQDFIGKILLVAIVQADVNASNMIVSELKPWMHKSLTLGSMHDVTITQVHPYGIQVEINNTRLRGFVHISNMSNEYVSSVTNHFQVGEKARVMSIKGRNPQQVSFSFVQLESERGLLLRNKERVYREADEMAMKFREGLSAEECILFGPTSGDTANIESECLSAANMQWLHLVSERKVV